jgi:hypothetical protein
MEAENAQLEAGNERQAPEVEQFNFWRRYRAYRAVPDPPDMTVYQMNQFKAARQNIAFVPPRIQAHEAIPPFGGYVKRDILRTPTDPTRERLKRKFLDQPIPELYGQWKGIKAFGEGARRRRTGTKEIPGDLLCQRSHQKNYHGICLPGYAI